MLGQRGNFGICKYPHSETEPWHENLCLHNPSLLFEEQLLLMKNGKGLLKMSFGKEPEVYCPINHLYDENTIKVAQVLKYKYFMDLNLQDIKPHENNGLIILPEAKIGEKEAEKSIAIYSHYGDSEKIKEALKNGLILPYKLEIGRNSEHVLIVNEIKKKIRKLEKDLRKLKEKYKIE